MFVRLKSVADGIFVESIFEGKMKFITFINFFIVCGLLSTLAASQPHKHARDSDREEDDRISTRNTRPRIANDKCLVCLAESDEIEAEQGNITFTACCKKPFCHSCFKGYRAAEMDHRCPQCRSTSMGLTDEAGNQIEPPIKISSRRLALLDSQLFLAIIDRNPTDVERALIDGANPNARKVNDGNYSALQLAAQYGNLETIRLLIDHGASKSIKSDTGNSLLHFAVKSNSIAVIQYILDELDLRAEINVPNCRGETPLHVAAQKGSIDLFLLMVDTYGALLGMKNLKNEKSVIHYAAAGGNETLIDHLIQMRGFSPNELNKKQKSPLCFAIKNGHLETAQKLISYGSRQDILTRTGKNLLHYASQSTSSDMLNYVLDTLGFSGQIDAVTHAGINPLCFTLKYGPLSLVENLVARGAQIESKCSQENSLLHFAVESKSIEIIEYALLKLGQSASLHATNQAGEYPLHFAAKAGSPELITYLVTAGANPFAETYQLETILHYAAGHGNVGLISHLIDHYHISVNALNSHGQTPLWFATSARHLSTAKHLIADHNANAEPSYTDSNGCTLLHIAAKSKSEATLNYVLDTLGLTAHINTPDNNGTTALCIALQYGPLSLVQNLIARGANTKISMSGESLLHFAVQSNNEEIIRYALEDLSQASGINTSNNKGNTPLLLAAYTCSPKVFDLLVNRGADPMKLNTQNQSNVLHNASSSNNITLVNHLIEYYHVPVNALDANNQTPLHYAIKSGEVSIIELLCSKYGAETKIKNKQGNTLAHCAAESKSEAILNYVLDNLGEISNLQMVNYANETLLCLALKSGSLPVIKNLIAREICTNTNCLNGNSLLHYAVENSSLNVIAYTLEALGQSRVINNANNYGEMPIHLAARSCSPAAFNFLVEKGADPLALTVKTNSSALHYAAGWGNQKLITTLITNYGLTQDARDFKGRTPLYLAIQNNQLSLAKLLISTHHANTKIRTDKGNTLLQAAAKSKSEATLNYVLDSLGFAAYLNTPNDSEKTILCSALKHGPLSLVQNLIDRGAKIDYYSEGNTLLHFAAQSNTEEIIRYTLESLGQKPALNVPNNSGNTPLLLAAKSCSPEIFQLLVNAGANAMNTNMHTHSNALFYATGWGNIQLVCFLIEKYGFSPNTGNKSNKTAFCNAVHHGHMATIELLSSKYHADASVKTTSGDTLAHFAAQSRSEATLNYVLDTLGQIINLNTPNKSGDTLLCCALESGSLPVVQNLHMRGAIANAACSNGNTLLHFAAKSNSLAVVRYAIEELKQHIHVNTLNRPVLSCPRTPLQEACCNASPKFIDYLITQGANKSVRNNNGDSLLHYAAANGNKVLTSHLIEYYHFNVDDLNTMQVPALCYATEQGHLPTIKNLIETHNATRHINSLNRNTLLHYAALCKALATPKYVLDNLNGIANIDSKNLDGVSPINLAIRNNNLRTAQLFINHRINRIRQTEEESAILQANDVLHSAVQNGSLDQVIYLLDHKGADINSLNIELQTPLDVAVSAPKTLCPSLSAASKKLYIEQLSTIREELKRRGAKHSDEIKAEKEAEQERIKREKEQQEREKAKILETPIREGNFQQLIALITTPGSTYSIHGAMNCIVANNNPANMIEQLHTWANETQGLNILDTPDPATKKTPLMTAVDYSALQAAECLLTLGANIDTQNSDGQTALHVAVRKQFYGKQEKTTVYKLLRDKGASTSIKDKYNLTAKDLLPPSEL